MVPWVLTCAYIGPTPHSLATIYSPTAGLLKTQDRPVSKSLSLEFCVWGQEIQSSLFPMAASIRLVSPPHGRSWGPAGLREESCKWRESENNMESPGSGYSRSPAMLLSLSLFFFYLIDLNWFISLTSKTSSVMHYNFSVYLCLWGKSSFPPASGKFLLLHSWLSPHPGHPCFITCTSYLESLVISATNMLISLSKNKINKHKLYFILSFL